MSIVRTIGLAGILAALPIFQASAQSTTAAQTRLEGTWEYVPPLRGWTVYRGNTYIMFYTRPDSAATTSPPSEADQARLYRSMMLQSGTFAISDTVVTMNEVNSKNPRQNPVTWKWSYSLKGTLARGMYSMHKDG